MPQLAMTIIKQQPAYNELSSLKIIDAAIESNAFFAFKDCFPALERLTFFSCLLTNGLNHSC